MLYHAFGVLLLGTHDAAGFPIAALQRRVIPCDHSDNAEANALRGQRGEPIHTNAKARHGRHRGDQAGAARRQRRQRRLRWAYH